MRHNRLKNVKLDTSKSNSRKYLYLLAGILILAMLATSLINAFRNSLFMSDRDRLNIVFYGKDTHYYSLGIQGAGDYDISFMPDLKVHVPGGYGYYRIGALGKLISWDKKPEILKRTFSLASYSFVDYYFYSNTKEVYFGGGNKKALPQYKAIFFSESNMQFLDKLYLFVLLANKRDQDFRQITVQGVKNKDGDSIFADDQFEKKYTGYLFQKSYRNEMKNIQILYTKTYENAVRVGRILEGNGIRVGDISSSAMQPNNCTIIEDNTVSSLTAQRLQMFFKCGWKRGKTDIYDILFELGNAEKDWETQDSANN